MKSGYFSGIIFYGSWYLKQLKARWWIPTGLWAYYAACVSIDSGLLCYSAFLAGVAFGGFCASVDHQMVRRRFTIALYFMLSFPGIVVVWSSLREVDYGQRALLLIVGLAFLLVSIIFGRRLYVAHDVTTALRLSILLGPVFSGLLVGLAALVGSFGHHGVGNDRLLALAIWLMAITILSLSASIVCFALAAEPTDGTPPPPAKAA
jgi:hypothetical protein